MKNMFEDTNTMAEANAQNNPIAFETETSKEQASITPSVRGRREMYVFGEYFTPKRNA